MCGLWDLGLTFYVGTRIWGLHGFREGSNIETKRFCPFSWLWQKEILPFIPDKHSLHIAHIYIRVSL